MIEEILSWDNVLDAHKKTLKGKAKFKVAAIKFNENATQNLRDLVEEVRSGNYLPQGYNEFYVYEPKERLIQAPQYRDKIVQQMFNNVLRDFYEPKFIYDSYACIRGKGNHKAIQRLHHFARGAMDCYENPYLCKIDIKKFFYTIDRGVLKTILDRQLPCDATKANLVKIIDNHTDDKGLPLGNLLSQTFANIYMNEVDQHCKRKFKYKRYLRYADDIFVFCSCKSEAKNALQRISLHISKTLNLQVHQDKSQVVRLKSGFDGLGMRFYRSHRVLSNQNKRKSMRRGYTAEEFHSWRSFALMGNNHEFVRKVQKRNNLK